MSASLEYVARFLHSHDPDIWPTTKRSQDGVDSVTRMRWSVFDTTRALDAELAALRERANFRQPIVAEYGYLTPQAQWGDVERGNPLPYKAAA